VKITGILATAVALSAAIAIAAPVFAEQTAQQVVPGNSASRIIREVANDDDGPSASQPQGVIAGNSASRIARETNDVVAQTPVDSVAPATPTPRPAWVAQVLKQSARDARQQIVGSAVPGNTVSRIEGFSAIPETCADCGSRPWLSQSRTCRYGAQIADAIVVAAAVRAGKQEAIGFGNRPNPLAYMLALGAEDYIADNVIGARNPYVQMAANYTLCGASLYNAIKSLKR
jgi:hypothetical protein